MPSISDSQFLTILSGHGQRIIYWSKTTGSTDPFATGSTTTYGYGDPETVLTSGSFTAVVFPAKIEEETIESGFRVDDYRKLFFKSTDSPEYFEYVTFGNNAWIVLPVQERFNAGNIIFKKATVRKLDPSGSASIVKYLRQLNP